VDVACSAPSIGIDVDVESRRCCLVMTQGSPEGPPRVPTAVVGDGDHHGLNANRQPKVPAMIPTIGGEGVDHYVRTVKMGCHSVWFESFSLEIVSEVELTTGFMAEPRTSRSNIIVLILPKVAH
jgi:hypothetical protein